MAECVFCKIVAGEIPAHTVYQDDFTIAFMDLGQVNPGHVIVAVNPHRETIFDLEPDEDALDFLTSIRVHTV